jgi:hypothetical protein
MSARDELEEILRELGLDEELVGVRVVEIIETSGDVREALRSLGIDEDLIEHMVTTQLEPQRLAREAHEQLTPAVTGGEVPEGYEKVSCAGCGREAAIPVGSIPPGKAPFCPACGAAGLAGSRRERRRRARHRG